MATTLDPARLSPGTGEYPLDAGHLDEAFAPTGAPRRPYVEVIDALARHDLAVLRERVQSDATSLGLSFGRGRPLAVDPVPRLIEAAEWARLEAGLLQRARALNEFLLDAYGDQRAFAAGVVPRRLLDTSPGYEPLMRGLLDPAAAPVGVAGFDLVRGVDGALAVLEDNLRMPSGSSYSVAVREAVAPALGAKVEPRPQEGLAGALGEALRVAAPDGSGSASIAILSDGPEAGAWFEHLQLGRDLEAPVVTPRDLEPAGGELFARVERERRRIDVLYRRLDEDRLSDAGGAPTPLGELLLPALRAGTLRCLNAFGTGLGDDKLAHAYVEAMIRFYLGEEPLLGSVAGFDLGDEAARASAMERLDALVVKPRDGFGGREVTIMSRATESERRRALGRLRRSPERYVAQETVQLSSHPTVCAGRLRPRRVDLRPFVVSRPGGGAAMPCALTRYARGAGAMIVNSSRGGGCKDTWVVEGGLGGGR